LLDSNTILYQKECYLEYYTVSRMEDRWMLQILKVMDMNFRNSYVKLMAVAREKIAVPPTFAVYGM
jgi:hypothetical protein